MSNPKTIYVHKAISNVLNGGESTATVDRRFHGDIEYRLVDPNEQSKIDRIRAEIELMRERYRLNVRNYRDLERRNDEMMAGGSASACTNVLEIIDRISNEPDTEAKEPAVISKDLDTAAKGLIGLSVRGES